MVQAEAGISEAARAGLEAARQTWEQQRGELMHDMARLWRDLDRKDEMIRKLENQLKSSYAGAPCFEIYTIRFDPPYPWNSKKFDSDHLALKFS